MQKYCCFFLTFCILDKKCYQFVPFCYQKSSFFLYISKKSSTFAVDFADNKVLFYEKSKNISTWFPYHG